MKVTIASRSNYSLRDILARSENTHIPGAEEILRDCIVRSREVRFGLIDGDLACMWGLIPPTILSSTAWLWLVTTEIVAENKFLFVRNSQRWIEEALKIYPEIIGDCIVGNDPAIRWLKWLGAEFQAPVDGRIPFMIRAKNG